MGTDRPVVLESSALPPCFQGPATALGTSQEPRRSTVPRPYRLAISFQGHGALNREENSSPDRRRRARVASRCRACKSRAIPSATGRGSGISTGFPFSRTPRRLGCLRRSTGVAFARRLGPADPCTTDVHMEPFSTSVLKGLTRVFATTTKICTGGGSRPARAGSLLRAPPRPSYSPGLRDPCGPVLPRRSSIGRTLERHPFSGLVASAGELLHTP